MSSSSLSTSSSSNGGGSLRSFVIIDDDCMSDMDFSDVDDAQSSAFHAVVSPDTRCPNNNFNRQVSTTKLPTKTWDEHVQQLVSRPLCDWILVDETHLPTSTSTNDNSLSRDGGTGTSVAALNSTSNAGQNKIPWNNEYMKKLFSMPIEFWLPTTVTAATATAGICPALPSTMEGVRPDLCRWLSSSSSLRQQQHAGCGHSAEMHAGVGHPSVMDIENLNTLTCVNNNNNQQMQITKAEQQQSLATAVEIPQQQWLLIKPDVVKELPKTSSVCKGAVSCGDLSECTCPLHQKHCFEHYINEHACHRDSQLRERNQQQQQRKHQLQQWLVSTDVYAAHDRELAKLLLKSTLNGQDNAASTDITKSTRQAPNSNVDLPPPSLDIRDDWCYWLAQ